MGMSPSNSNQRRSLGNIINRVFESAGPEGKVRGTPQQIIDKYQALARDAQLAGDRVAAESFLQHSEHYSRLLGEAQAAQNEARQAYEQDRDDQRGGGEPRRDDMRSQEGRPQDGRRDEPRRDDGRRDEGRRDEGARAEGFDRPRSGREPQPQLSSALAMIDPTEDGEIGGLIETPESGSRAASPSPAPMPAPEPLPEPLPQPTAAEVRPPQGSNGAAHLAPAPEPAAAETAQEAAEPPREAPKRGRPRRKAPRPDGEAAPAQAE